MSYYEREQEGMMDREKKLSQLFSGLDFIPAGPARRGAGNNSSADPVILGIAYDSRRVEPGFLFVALRGEHTDGHHYLKAAAERGAAAFVVEDTDAAEGLAVPCLVTNDTREALSVLSARFYDAPADALYLIGVTGTDGKSTTVFFIHQLLELAGFRAGFLSTVAMKTGDETIDNPFRQSTPEAPEIHELLRRMADAGKQFAVVEATSHGLSPKTRRLADVSFDAGVLTNIAHEHLEFHGTQEQYRDAKTNLFRCLGQSASKAHGLPRVAVVNGDDPEAGWFARAAGAAVLFYGIGKQDADLRAVDLTPDGFGTRFLLREKNAACAARLPVPGDFNVENLLAALLTVRAVTGLELSRLAPLSGRLKPVRGRLERLDRGQPFQVIVDFAHTPQAFTKLLPLMRSRTHGRLIVVFGSAGERDRAKRRMQGEAAARHADIVVLADEDPRGEEPMAVLEEIAAGCATKTRGENLFLVPDRREAIGQAFLMARPEDSVLLLGKGHETSIIYKDRVLPWNERKTAEELLSGMGF